MCWSGRRDAARRSQGEYIASYLGTYVYTAVGEEIGLVCDRRSDPNYMMDAGPEQVCGRGAAVRRQRVRVA